MKKYTCLLVDDETLARELITSYIAKIPYLELQATCANAIEAQVALETHPPDLLFLDIQMPDLSGLELLRMMKKHPATIITTAFTEHALEGYELDVLDYLLKPIEFERFFKAISKAIAWIERGTSTPPTEWPIPPVSQPNDYFFVKSDYKIVKVIFAEILYIEAMQKYVRIHGAKERLMTLMSMSQLEAALPIDSFVRIHRSFIVNMDKIDSIDGNQVQIGKIQLPISKGQREDFLERIRGKALGH